MERPRPTPELTKELCKRIRRGNYRGVAAGLCGLDRKTLYEWCKRGARGEEPYAAFAKALDRAEDACEASLVRTVKVASRDDYKAATWMLASKYPDRWHRESKAAEERAVKKSTAQIINALSKVLTPEQWERAVHAIADIGCGAEEACADALTAGTGVETGPEPDSGPDNCVATPETT